jgi:hypothetical protein
MALDAPEIQAKRPPAGHLAWAGQRVPTAGTHSSYHKARFFAKIGSCPSKNCSTRSIGGFFSICAARATGNASFPGKFNTSPRELQEVPRVSEIFLHFRRSFRGMHKHGVNRWKPGIAGVIDTRATTASETEVGSPSSTYAVNEAVHRIRRPN